LTVINVQNANQLVLRSFPELKTCCIGKPQLECGADGKRSRASRDAKFPSFARQEERKEGVPMTVTVHPHIATWRMAAWREALPAARISRGTPNMLHSVRCYDGH